MPSPDEMRKTVAGQYPGDSWPAKVKTMSDAQVYMIYKGMAQKKENKK